MKWGFVMQIQRIMYCIWLGYLNIGTPKQSATISQMIVLYDTVYLKKNKLYAEMHPNLCAVYAAHLLYSALFSIQLQYCSLPFLISFSRLLIIVLQIMVLSETVVVLVIHKAC